MAVRETAKELDSEIEIVRPWVVLGKRRFYSKRLLLRAVTSVATEQTSFSAIAN